MAAPPCRDHKILRASMVRLHADLFSYEHDKIDEPAILLGGGFVVDI